MRGASWGRMKCEECPETKATLVAPNEALLRCATLSGAGSCGGRQDGRCGMHDTAQF